MDYTFKTTEVEERSTWKGKDYRSKLNGCRYYKIGGKTYFSVTSILDWLSAKGLSKWRTRTTQKQQDKASIPAMRAGSELDALFHTYLAGNVPDVPECFEPAWDKFIEMVDVHKIQSLKQNYVVYSEKLGFAGELDDIALFDNELVVIDWKTGGKYNTVEPQMAAYRYALKEMHPEVTENVGTVCGQIKRDGSFSKAWKTEHIRETTHAFMATFDMFKYDCYYELKEMNWPWLGTWATEKGTKCN